MTSLANLEPLAASNFAVGKLPPSVAFGHADVGFGHLERRHNRNSTEWPPPIDKCVACDLDHWPTTFLKNTETVYRCFLVVASKCGSFLLGTSF